eukprot:m51a1_g1523 hypothetical protein (1621) ;mRNA; f:445505-451523
MHRSLGILLFLSASAALGLAGCAPDDAPCLFGEFKARYHRAYATPAEEARRYEIFQARLRDIERLNREVPTATFAVNELSDLSEAEFTERYANLDARRLRGLELPDEPLDAAANGARRGTRDVPASWTSPDVTPVQSQGGCGSCWAFAAMGCVEAAWHKATGQTRRFAPQSLVDCDTGSSGCAGGWPDSAMSLVLRWTQQGFGAVLEADYPYRTADGQCYYDSVKSKAVGKLTGVFGIKFDEAAMGQKLLDYGPIVIYLDADSLHSYKSGVVESTTECTDGVNHAVLLVGWGQDNAGGYWLIKNSWGSWWGENGFFRLRRGRNTCLVTDYKAAGAIASAQPSPSPQPASLSGTLALRTYWGTYMSAQDDGTLLADRWGRYEWETFTVEANAWAAGAVSLRSYHGTYLSVDAATGAVRLSSVAQASEAFVPVDVGGGRVALRCSGGQYLSVDDAPDFTVGLDRNLTEAWEWFEALSVAPAAVSMCAPGGTCALRNRSCGTVDNGCGGILSCGACPAGSVCTAAGACVDRRPSDWAEAPSGAPVALGTDGSFTVADAAVRNFRLHSSAALVGDHWTAFSVSALLATASGFVGVGVRMGQSSGPLDGAWFRLSASRAQLCVRHGGRDTCDDGEAVDFAPSAWHNVTVQYWLAGGEYFGLRAVVDGAAAPVERRVERRFLRARGSAFVVSGGAGSAFRGATVATRADVHVELGGSRRLTAAELASQVAKLLGVGTRDVLGVAPSAGDSGSGRYAAFDFALADSDGSANASGGVGGAYGLGTGAAGEQMASAMADRLVQMVAVEKSLAQVGIDVAAVGLAPAAVNAAAAVVAPAAASGALSVAAIAGIAAGGAVAAVAAVAAAGVGVKAAMGRKGRGNDVKTATAAAAAPSTQPQQKIPVGGIDVMSPKTRRLSITGPCIFGEFKAMYNKAYSSPAEEARRFSIFQDTLRQIERLNREVPTATFDVNEFADLSKDEFAALYTNFNPQHLEDLELPGEPPETAAAAETTGPALPSSWTSPDVTPVQRQGGCGSCWAFAAMGCVEAAWHKATGETKWFSPQSLIDCDTRSSGCGGGYTNSAMSLVLRWTQQGFGAVLESDYPYRTANGQCYYDSVKSKAVGKLTKILGITFDEATMNKNLINYGPMIVHLDASSLHSYKRGVIESTDICLDGVNHAVLLVGWGQDSAGGYWLIKNSWGAKWGENGFFRLRRGRNTCLVTNEKATAAVAPQKPLSVDLSGSFALRTHWGTFLSAQNNGAVKGDRRDLLWWETFTAETNSHVAGAMSFKSYKGSFLSVDPGNDQVSLRGAANTWEAFTVYNMGNGKVALRCLSGKYLSVDKGPHYKVTCDEYRARGFELFEVVHRDASVDITGAGAVALRTHWDTYISAQDDGSVKGDRREPLGWEMFTVDSNSNVVGSLSFMSHRGGYLSADPGNGEVRFRDAAGPWESFVPYSMDNGKIALRCLSGRYLSVDKGPGFKVTCSETRARGFELFEVLLPNMRGIVALRTHWGTYISALDDGTVQGDRREPLGWETFTVDANSHTPASVSFKSHRGTFLAADPNNGQVRFSNAADTWESFVPIYTGNGKVALRCINGRYLSVDKGPGYKVTCTETRVRSFELFEVVHVPQ